MRISSDERRKESQALEIFTVLAIIIVCNSYNTASIVYRVLINPNQKSFSLYEAEVGLNLPNYARNYIHCSSKKSEVSCDQVVHAWNVIHNWELTQNRLNRSIADSMVVHVSPRCGSANQIFHIISGGVLALVFNRTYYTEDMLKGFDVPPQSLKKIVKCKTRKRHMLFTHNDYNFLNFTYKQLLENNNTHYAITYSLQTRYYLIPGVGDYILNHFGYHLVYFLGNYFIRLNRDIFEHVKYQFSAIPNHIQIWGLHLRYQNGHRAFIQKNLNRCFKVVVPFLEEKTKKKPSVFFIASDEEKVRKKLIENFPNRSFCLSPLQGTNPAMNDFIMLMNCDELLLTFRSTFSYLTSALTQRNAYMLNMDFPYVLKYTSSQVGIGMILRETYYFSKLTNKECILTPSNEHLMRKYISNYVL